MNHHNKTRKNANTYNPNNENFNAILNNIQLPKHYELITDQYTYNVKIEYGEETDIINVIQLNNSFMECIVLSVPHKGTIADLLNVNYYSECARNFQRGSGTVHIVNTLLKYTLDTYPHIRQFRLKDTTNINEDIDKTVHTPFYVTTRRLLKGELGWYEEKFGAQPINDTIEIIRFLRGDDRHIIQNLIPVKAPQRWWTEENVSQIIKKICLKTDKINPSTLQTIIFFSEWTIPTENVAQIPYEIREINSGGGVRRIRNIIKNMKTMRMPLRKNRMNIGGGP